MLDNFFWYVAWTFNFPESFKDLIDQSMLFQSIKILIGSWNIVLPSLAVIMITVYLLRENFKKALNQLIFGASWLFLGLLPIIALVNHSYTVYLSFAGLGIIFAIAISLKKSKGFVICLVATLWLASSFYNLDFTRKTHWVVNEQAISKAYTTFTSNKLLNPESGSVILVREAGASFAQKNGFTSSGELGTVKQSLFNQDAMQVIYNNSTIKSYYVKSPQPISFPHELTIYDLEQAIVK